MISGAFFCPVREKVLMQLRTLNLAKTQANSDEFTNPFLEKSLYHIMILFMLFCILLRTIYAQNNYKIKKNLLNNFFLVITYSLLCGNLFF